MSPRRLFFLLLLAAVAFGVLVAVIKGQEVGVRNAVGNMSAPWIVVPFLAGTFYSRTRQAALIGGATTLAAFFGFYAAEAAVLDLGGHPWYVDLRLTLGSGHVYEIWGTPAGVVYGILGSLWAYRGAVAAGVALGLAFVFEPLMVWGLVQADVWGGGGLLDYPLLWVAEIVIGLALIAWMLTRRSYPGAPNTATSERA